MACPRRTPQDRTCGARSDCVQRPGRTRRPRSCRARNNHGRRACAQDVRQGGGGHQGVDEAGLDGHDQPGSRSGNGDHPGRGDGAQRKSCKTRRPRGIHCRKRRCGRGRADDAAAGGHGHGARRPRQDFIAGLHPPHQGGGRRGRRHHPAYRRVPRRNCARRRDIPGHAGPRGVYRDARARCEGHRHRRAGGGRR